ISTEVEVASSRLQTVRREEWKSRKKAFSVYRLTCQNLSNATGNLSTNNSASSFGNGSVDSGSRTATLLLRKQTPQSPSISSRSSFRTLGRSSSLRRVATLSTTRPSMEMSGSGGQSVLPAKVSVPEHSAARSVWRTFFDLYRSSMASEEARIDLHSALYQNTFKLFDLERLRLTTLHEILESYRSAIINFSQIIDTAFKSTKESVVKANPEEDFLSFHGKAVPESDATSDQSSNTTPSRLTNHSLGFHHKRKPQPMAVVGRTQQNLLSFPGEEDSLYAPSEAIHRHNIRKTLQKQFLVFPEEVPNIDDDDELAASTKKSERAAFARQLLVSILEILVRDCQKEERTKQGLTNLVTVYSSKPVFTDDATLIEARRRLFSSRCRLGHLLACRARLACIFHHLSSSVHSNSLQNRLLGAGFAPNESDQTFTRRVDVSTPPHPPSIQLEWPPVTLEVSNLESIPLTELDVVNPLLVNDKSRFSWIVQADSLFGSTGGSSSIEDNDDDVEGVSSNDEDVFDEKSTGYPKSVPLTLDKPTSTYQILTPVATNGNSTKSENGVKKTVTSPNRTTIERFPVRSAGTVSRNISSQMSSPPPPTTSQKTQASAKPLVNSTPSKIVAPSKVRTPPKSTLQTTKLVSSTIPAKRTTSRQSISSPVKQPERKILTSTSTTATSKSTKPTPKTTTTISKSKPLNISRSKSLTKSPTPNNANDSPAFMDEEDIEEDLKKTLPAVQPQAALQTTVQEKRRITLERVNGCGDKLEAMLVEEANTTTAKTEEGNPVEKKKSSSRLFSRLAVGSNKKSKNQRPQIVTPWRVEPNGDGSTHNCTSNKDEAPEYLNGDTPAVAISPPKDPQDPLQMWPSLASLSCIGWAKVVSDYSPCNPGELALLEGDIVSILQKTTANWWLGEAGGKSGRFPVSCVEEF
ncbi:unnamed protein product, partial [Rodentolepis nana]|uniref:SH3 domain-containing protein n=1 Tax=Rodentolepis nana TaxID=102285 RepID=A0A0R3T897_RODNA